ncbi:MAG TPA: hypothetical protein VJ729_07150 [Nitrososphaeraceae archaeon]|nr:hypothetical protein [Nitrososphaeraceae archaeon]
MRPGLKIMLSSDNENHEEPKAIKAAEEIKQKQRESEQLNVDPEEIIEEEERIHPHSVDE